MNCADDYNPTSCPSGTARNTDTGNCRVGSEHPQLTLNSCDKKCCAPVPPTGAPTPAPIKTCYADHTCPAFYRTLATASKPRICADAGCVDTGCCQAVAANCYDVGYYEPQAASIRGPKIPWWSTTTCPAGTKLKPASLSVKVISRVFLPLFFHANPAHRLTRPP